MDEDLDTIVGDWPTEWSMSVNVEELSDIVVGPPPDAPVYQAQAQEIKESSKTPMNSKMDFQFKETKEKRRHEKGEGRRTA